MFTYSKKEYATKLDFYEHLNEILEGLIRDEKDWLANLSNSAALFGHFIEDINWVGFYLYKDNELVLGPFWGHPACTHIAVGEGVCGAAALELSAQVVPDVHQFPDHIACDSASNSEIVVPILDSSNNFWGVLDIDSPLFARFDEEDRIGLQKTVQILLKYVDWPKACR